MKLHCSPLLAGISLLTLLGSCSNSPVSTTTSGDGTTITAEGMAEATLSTIDESESMSELLSFDNPAPESVLTLPALPIPATTSVSALSKKSAGAAVALDTIDDILRVTTYTKNTLAEKYDTIDILLDVAITNAVEGDESIVSLRGKTIFAGGAIEHYSVKDLDGDNIINRGNSTVQAELTIETAHGSDVHAGETVKTVTTFKIDAGSDGNFTTESDNELQYAAWIKSIDGESVASAVFSDGDGDGSISPLREGTTIITLFNGEKVPRPLTGMSRCLLHVDRNSQGIERISRFSLSRTSLTGRTTAIFATTLQGDSTLVAGEKILIHVATQTPDNSDSLYNAETIYTIDPGVSLGDSSDNVLYALSYHQVYRLGFRKSSAFTCTFDPGVAQGETPQAGVFGVMVTYKNNATTKLEGSFTPTSLLATYTDTKGETTDAAFARN